ncbi:hypothetical protein GJA_4205 [Janthinobacterium agaricidamnosum NBRC 102515 = DSM 9628]|uniref:DUF3304 domain-containing protein n=1 Tax=Janthinobacterium agaricidamnosum NBRC 102515 = DSM 9628 TaxID=1349767 RepID=W0VB05_9BURK|nr:DUF3304 domain-containing protein [Janthinobacterium agaricidamnosum]CDG84815.1 hypothetical protein GJA_4205 [Janthinobacterium agaricidamnosum NBRC 102515 = DSM 9628]
MLVFNCRSALMLVLAAALSVIPAAAMAGGIQSLNYSSREVGYIAVENPGNTNSGGGGDALNPYSGGGTICCFEVPEKWHPDLQVVVAYQFYPDPTMHRETVTIPPYPKGEAGDIWLIVYEDSSVGAVVSKYGPSLPEWPGKIKGYPVPTKEYRMERRMEKLQREKNTLLTMERGLRRDAATLSTEQVEGIKGIIEFQKKLIEYLEKNNP